MGSTIRAAHIHRYSSIPILLKESVAEHSFYVALYAQILSDYLRLGWDDRRLAIESALLHDIEESLTGDFLRSFKKSNPTLEYEIKKAAEQCAFKVISEAFNHADAPPTFFWKGAKVQSPSGRIVQIADFLSVVSYLCKEAALGNKYAMAMMETELMQYLSLFRNAGFTDFQDILDEVEGIIREGWKHVTVTV